MPSLRLPPSANAVKIKRMFPTPLKRVLGGRSDYMGRIEAAEMKRGTGSDQIPRKGLSFRLFRGDSKFFESPGRQQTPSLFLNLKSPATNQASRRRFWLRSPPGLSRRSKSERDN